MSDQKSISVIDNTAGYFERKAEELEALLDEVQIPKAVRNAAMADAIISSAREGAVESIPFVGGAINKILGWNDKVNEEVTQAKRDHLLIGYINRSEDHARALEQLKELISSPQGNALFNKVLWILDDNPPDRDLSRHLSAALENITQSDFIGLFETHRFALEIISRTSPAALAILVDEQRWPLFSMSFTQSSGTTITNDWVPEFTKQYANGVGLTHAIHQLQASLYELSRSGLMAARTTGQKGPAQVHRSVLGESLVSYLDR